MDNINHKIDFIIQTLAKLFNVESVPESDTEYFKKNNVSHAKLIRIFDYWIYQSAVVFGEPITLNQTQSLRDSGVDFIVEFISTKIKIGFQIKSYGDVKEKYFHKNVNAQIAESQRYDLQKLVIVIAGNLNDEKIQGQKIRGLIAELNQRSDDYLFIIPPEKVLPICRAFETRRHPLSFVMLDFKAACEIADGLGNSLSNKNRKVTVLIKTKYVSAPKRQGDKTVKMKLKLKPEDFDLLDRWENLHLTGETLTLSKKTVSEIIVDGKNQVDGGFKELKISTEEDYDKITLNILDDNKVTLIELEDLTFGKRIVGDVAYVTLTDKNQKALKLEFRFSQKIINFTCGVNFYNNELSQIRQAVEFSKALNEGKWIQIIIPKHGIDSKILLAEKQIKGKIDDDLLKITDALLVIEEKSGVKLKILPELWREDVDRIVQLAEWIKDEIFQFEQANITLKKKDAKQFLALFTSAGQYKEFTINTPMMILGKRISTNITCLTSDYGLQESIKDTLQRIEKLNEDEVIVIKLKLLNKNGLARMTIT